MLFSPFETFEHLKDSLCSYLETAYKISNRLVFSERGVLLRREALSPAVPAVSQDPFIESTPAFPGSCYLGDVIQPINELPFELLDCRPSAIMGHKRGYENRTVGGGVSSV